MKLIITIFFTCYAGLLFGQISYSSTYTEFLNDGDIELIPRLININEKEIEIISFTPEGAKVYQTLYIEEIIESLDNRLPSRIFNCRSLDSKTLYQVKIPVKRKVQEIFLTQVNLTTERIHDLKFIIDSKANSNLN